MSIDNSNSDGSTNLVDIPQPQQSDERFKDERVLLFGTARELYLQVIREYPEEVQVFWEEGWEECTNATSARRYVEQLFEEEARRRDEEAARQRWLNSLECKARQEKERILREKREQEQEAKLDFWIANQQRRRQQDALLPSQEIPSERDLNWTGQEYAHEFYQEFFSLEFMGYTAQYDSRMTGYRLPQESGLDGFIFDLSGTVYDQTVFQETGDWEDGTVKLPHSGFVWTYGAMVCGYRTSGKTGLFLDIQDYKRAQLGYAAWLREQVGEKEKEKNGYLPGTQEYWDKLFTHVSTSFLSPGKGSLREPPRTLYKMVAATVDKEERSNFEELKDEKTFKEFLLACIDGKHTERADQNKFCYFEVAKINWSKKVLFEVTFSTPAERNIEEELFGQAVGSGFLVPPSEIPISKPINWERLDAEAAEIRTEMEKRWDSSQK